MLLTEQLIKLLKVYKLKQKCLKLMLKEKLSYLNKRKEQAQKRKQLRQDNNKKYKQLNRAHKNLQVKCPKRRKKSNSSKRNNRLMKVRKNKIKQVDNKILSSLCLQDLWKNVLTSLSTPFHTPHSISQEEVCLKNIRL